MSRWKFVCCRDKMGATVEADTREEALAELLKAKVIRSTIEYYGLPSGLWEWSEGPIDKPTLPRWKFTYRDDEMTAIVEAATIVEAAAQLLAWNVVDLEVNPMRLRPEFWRLTEGPEEIPE